MAREMAHDVFWSVIFADIVFSSFHEAGVCTQNAQLLCCVREMLFPCK